MKIRNGFVSNSSSTSFIVMVNDKNICPHCGRGSADIITMIEAAERHSSTGDTRLRWTNPRDYLIELEEEVETEANTLRSYADLDDNDMGGYSKRYKIKDLRMWAQQTIDDRLGQMANINAAIEAGKQVIAFDVDYHDETLNSLVRDMITAGDLEVVKELD